MLIMNEWTSISYSYTAMRSTGDKNIGLIDRSLDIKIRPIGPIDRNARNLLSSSGLIIKVISTVPYGRPTAITGFHQNFAPTEAFVVP